MLQKGILFPIFVSAAAFSINARHGWAVLSSVQGMIREQNCFVDLDQVQSVCLGFKANLVVIRAMIKKRRHLDQCTGLERTLCVCYQFQSCFLLIKVLNILQQL